MTQTLALTDYQKEKLQNLIDYQARDGNIHVKTILQIMPTIFTVVYDAQDGITKDRFTQTLSISKMGIINHLYPMIVYDVTINPNL